MNLDELQSIQSKERQTDSLQPLRASFYEEVAEYIQSLRAERERVADEQGFDAPEFRRLSDEIDAAEDTVESLYERRVGKVVKAASFAAAGMPAEDEGLTAEEQDLFDTLVDDIKANRERVLDVLAGESEATDDTEVGTSTDDERPAPDPTPESSSEGVDAADLMGGEDTSIGEPAPDQSEGETPATPTAPDAHPSDDSGRETEDGDDGTDGVDAARADSSRDSPAPEPDDAPPDDPPEPSTDGGAAAATETVDRTTVRITRDVGEILGVDERAYDLGEDDVVTLPSANAAPLVERDAAERLE